MNEAAAREAMRCLDASRAVNCTTTPSELAEAAAVTTWVIAAFEEGREVPPAHEEAIRSALEAVGMTTQRDRKIDGLGVRGVLHRLDAFHYRLESRSEHGGCQLGHAFGIVDSGFDPFLDQSLL